MLKKISSIALLMSCAVYATEQSVAEYTGKVANLYMGKTDNVKVGIVRETSKELECDLNNETEWPLYFEQGQSYSKEWFDILNTVRRTQETIRIGYLPNANDRCAIEYLALLKGDGTNTDGGAVGDNLTRHGQYGNIALIYNNNLTESNYSSSDHSGGDVAAAAFDGYLWQDQIDEDSGSLINRGIWVVEKDTENQEKEYWLQVRFDDVVKMSGFRIMVNEKSVGLGRSPRSINILTSLDGEDFVDNGSYVLSKAVDQRANLDVKIELKYLRIKVNKNYGNSHIEIDEVEVYAD